MFKKNLLYSGLLSVTQFIFPIITFPYSSRLLGPQGIGSINFIDSFTQYFVLFAALGIPIYGVREISKCRGDRIALNKTFSEIFTIHLLSAGLFCVVYLAFGLFVPNVKVHFELVGIGILMIISGVLSAEWIFYGLEEFAYITSRTIIVRSLSVVFLFLFLRSDSRPVVYYSIMASGVVMNGFVNMVYLRKFIKISFYRLELKKHIRPLLIILGSTLAVSIYLLMDNVILGFMQGELAVGYYATALRIVRLPLALITAINSVIIPQVSRAFDKKDFKLITSLANKSFSLICIITLPLTVGLYISSYFLINIFAGIKFENSIIALQILTPLVLVTGIANLISVQLLAPMGKESYLFKAYFISMVFSLLINILLIKIYSYKGASLGMILTEFLATVICYHFLKKSATIKIDLKIFFQSAIGALFFFPIAFLVRHFIPGFVIKETVTIVCCMVFYAVYVIFFINNIYINNLKNFLIAKFFKQSLTR